MGPRSGTFVPICIYSLYAIILLAYGKLDSSTAAMYISTLYDSIKRGDNWYRLNLKVRQKIVYIEDNSRFPKFKVKE